MNAATPRTIDRADRAECDLTKIAILIPAWQPSRCLVDLFSRLLEAGCGAIIVVNDGSDQAHDEIFEELVRRAPSGEPCRFHLLRHAVNLGKGRALKTGLNYFLNEYPDFDGVVTADADGQHNPEDILNTARELSKDPSALILGERRFKGGGPLRSRVGNTATRYVFAVLTGKNLADTQSGLRGIPTRFVPACLRLDGERYEYEMNMLINAAGSHGIRTVPIEAIYFDGNRSSHFNPLLDSMRIYFVLLRFFASSVVAAALDFVVFTIVFAITSNLLISIIAGRVSSLANFALNRKFVFNSGGGIVTALIKYYILVACMGAASYLSIHFLSASLGVNVLAAKIISETALWLASFSAQRTLVFAPRQSTNS